MTKKKETGATPRQYDAAFVQGRARAHVAGQRPSGRGQADGVSPKPLWLSEARRSFSFLTWRENRGSNTRGRFTLC